MEIKNFKMDGMERIAERFMGTHYVNREEICNILSTTNVSFLAIGLTRAESTLLCELKDSYVQQSQRYCNMGKGGYKIPEKLSSAHKEIACNLIESAVDLYKKMTVLKDDNIKKPSIGDFKYGIPYEDGRYIFPLAFLTNVSVSMSGDKLLELFTMCKRHKNLTKDFYNALTENIDSRIVVKLASCVESDHSNWLLSSETYFHDLFNNIPEGGIFRIYADNDVKNIAIGALTSTTAGDPIDVYNESKSIGLIDRVAFNYGHIGILEQCRNTYGFSCSLSAYHQVIRHRIATLHRESIPALIFKENSSFYVPKTIENSIFYSKYCDLVYMFHAFIDSIQHEYAPDIIFPLMLNCDRVKFISSSNIRNDMYIFRERLCNRAQEEIRELYTKKHNDLMEILPEIYMHAGPPCANGPCKEGKMSCGKPFKKKEVYV